MQVLIYRDNQVFSKTGEMLKAWCTVCECELHRNSGLFVTHVGLGEKK